METIKLYFRHIPEDYDAVCQDGRLASVSGACPELFLLVCYKGAFVF